MQLSIYCSIVLVALSSAKQLKKGLQILPEKSSSKIDKRSVNQEFNYYFSPEEIQAQQAVQSQDSASIESLQQNSAISEETYNELIQKYYAENLKPAPIEEPQEQARSSSNFFLPKEEFVYNNKPKFTLNSYRQLLMDQNKLSRHVQNAQKNKINQANPSVTDSAFFKPESDSNRNKDQRNSLVEKEIEYILRNAQTRQLNSLNQIRDQNSGINAGQKKSAVEKEIENAWRQHQAFEFERSNSPDEISEQIPSVRNENQDNTEVEKQFEYILRNGQVYGFERSNAPNEVNNQGSQSRNEAQNESELERKIENFWRKQQDFEFQRPSVPAGIFNQDSLDWNEIKGNLEVDKQFQNIFRQPAFEFESSYSPADVINQNPSGKKENQDNSEIEKQIEFILRNRQAEFERENAPEVNHQNLLITNMDQNKSDVEKEIQNILKKHQAFELQRSKSAAKAISQSPLIQIHENVSVTKHLPVPVFRTVKVSVPTPVLVPILQPYEIKVPHLYPVPLKVVKHIPVSMRHY